MGSDPVSSNSQIPENNQQPSKLPELNHELSPQELVDINANIVQLLSSSDVDEFELMKLIEQRGEVVERQLSMLPEQDSKRFAELEKPINDDLLAVVSNLKTEIEKVLSKVSKASKAIKKYRQA